VKATLVTMATILSIMGLLSFSLFILQEADQTTQWATRLNHDNPQALIKGQQLTARILNRMRIINYFTWINPYAHYSYAAYIQSRDRNPDS